MASTHGTRTRRRGWRGLEAGRGKADHQHPPSVRPGQRGLVWESGVKGWLPTSWAAGVESGSLG